MEKNLPVEVDVPEKMSEWGRIKGAIALVQAIGDLSLIAFYFLLRVGEYTVKFRSLVVVPTDANEKQTNQF